MKILDWLSPCNIGLMHNSIIKVDLLLLQKSCGLYKNLNVPIEIQRLFSFNEHRMIFIRSIIFVSSIVRYVTFILKSCFNPLLQELSQFSYPNYTRFIYWCEFSLNSQKDGKKEKSWKKPLDLFFSQNSAFWTIECYI